MAAGASPYPAGPARTHPFGALRTRTGGAARVCRGAWGAGSAGGPQRTG